MDDAELRLNEIRKQIRQLFNEAREVGSLNPEYFDAFKADLTVLVEGEANASLSFPHTAPELFKQRSDRKEKPDAFVRRTYAPWLEQKGGLPRPIIRELDEPLYRALYKHGFPKDFETKLPPAKGRSAQHIGMTPTEILSKKRDADKARYQKHISNLKS